MAINWGTFRDQIRRSILKDESAQKWTNDMLRDYVWWALDAFCAHTAVATSTSYAGDGTTKVFQLPENVYDSIDATGSVFLQTGDLIEYLLPVYYTPGMTIQTDQGFFTWPTASLNTVVAPSSSTSLMVYYYAYYNHPYADSDLISLPSWAYEAVAYLVGVYALSNYSVREALMAQFKSRQDSGTPEDHSLRIQQEWWLKLYDTSLSRHAKQDRSSLVRIT